MVTLSGTNTYLGDTSVSNGTLVVSGSLAAGSAVYVAPAATLAGGGTIGGPVTVDGKLTPGTSPGSITMNTLLTLNAGSETVIEINRSLNTFDQVQGLTTVNYGGTLTVTNLGGTFANGDSYPLFGATTHNGNFTATNLPTLGSGLKWNWASATGVLSVETIVNTTPTNITAVVSGSQLTLSWPTDHTGWTLQSQTNALATGLSGTWYPVSGSTATNAMTFTVDPAKPTVFYRLVYP